MKRVLAAGTFSLIATLTACAPRQQMTWVTSADNIGNFKKDRYECSQQPSQAITPTADYPTTNDFIRCIHFNPLRQKDLCLNSADGYDINVGNRLMEACMNARGWTLKAVPVTNGQNPQTQTTQ
jgi:hypothetical protein